MKMHTNIDLIQDCDKPAYLRVAATIRKALAQGVFEIGDWLPSTYQLAEKWKLHRHTIREGLAELEAEGIIESVERKGFQIKWKPPHPLSAPP